MLAPSDDPIVPPLSPDDALADTAAGSSPSVRPDESVDKAPRRIGRFVVLRQLGQGGMGTVYAAYDEKLDRKVAVKVLHGHEFQTASQRTRVLREAQAMAQVSHPNVVHAYEVGEVDSQVFLAMEYVEGSTLTTWQRQPGKSWEEILRIYLSAGQGLLAAHRVGLVHRDFKPENVLVDKDNRPLVADFGLAHGAGRHAAKVAHHTLDSGRLLESPLTVTGSIVGTPAYMSPEQYRGDVADSRSDQFCFCVALYEALYKQLPFAGRDLAELSTSVQTGRVRAVPSGTLVPQAVEEALRRGLSVEASERFPSMAELIFALNLDVQPPLSPMPAASRRLQLLVCFCALLLAVSAINMLRLLGTLQVRHMLAGAMLLLVAGIGLWILLLRRGALQNSFHRGVAFALLTFLAGFVEGRLVGLLLGLQVHQVVAMELVLFACTTAMVSQLFLPILRPLPFICAAASIAIATFPTLVWMSFGIVYPLVGLGYTLAWYRVARRMGHASA